MASMVARWRSACAPAATFAAASAGRVFSNSSNVRGTPSKSLIGARRSTRSNISCQCSTEDTSIVECDEPNAATTCAIGCFTPCFCRNAMGAVRKASTGHQCIAVNTGGAHHTARCRALHRARRATMQLIKRGKTAAVLHRQRQQIRVGDLIGSEDLAQDQSIRFRDRDDRPARIRGRLYRSVRQRIDGYSWSKSALVARLRHDMHHTVLGKRTRRPAICNVG